MNAANSGPDIDSTATYELSRYENVVVGGVPLSSGITTNTTRTAL
jgi:hypothetical protein